MFSVQSTPWPIWKKISFRFLFIYLVLQMSPWTWLDVIPVVTSVTRYYQMAWDWLVELSNKHLFHIRTVLVPKNGSGDTSYGWAELYLMLVLALVGCIGWSLLDRKRPQYDRLNYWLCLFARYYVAAISFTYGIDKLFVLQMPFPNLHQLATPLGDLLPMRFSWMFVGYSPIYQFFSGMMEVIAGLLLLYRRTATLGTLVALGVFINVMMLNLCYDIPVKIFSMQMVFTCLFLLANEARRLIAFLVLNRPVATSHTYDFNYPKKWMRIARWVLKIAFILVAVGWQIYTVFGYYRTVHQTVGRQPVANGVYAVSLFSRNHQDLTHVVEDSTRWQDVILEDGTGSISTTDTAFRQRYRRAYFSYRFDTVAHALQFRKMKTDSLAFMSLNYELPDANTIQLRGRKGQDSLFVILKNTHRHFQLAEGQFHWLSEYNR